MSSGAGGLRTTRARVAFGLVVALIVVLTLVSVVIVESLRSTSVPVATSPLRMAVIGDSYSAGSGEVNGWPTLMANTSSVGVTNVSLPNSGFLADAGGVGNFQAQAAKAIAAHPDVIVVFGGLYDVGKPTEQLAQAATDLFVSLARSAPAAKLVVVGPLWYTVPVPEVIVDIDETVGKVAQRLNITYLRVLDEPWLHAPGLVDAESSQPTDAGQQVLASELAAQLRRIGLPID